MSPIRSLLTGILLTLAPLHVHAWLAENVAIHGFISQGYLHSVENDFLAHTRQGTFQFHESGINFTTDLNEDLWVGMQLFARRLGERDNNHVMLDWAVGDYHPCDQWGLRIGKLRQPVGLYNEIRDVDAVRTFIFLPLSVYPESNRNYQLAFLGASVYGNLGFGCCGKIAYDAFLGAQEVNADDFNVRTAFESAAKILGTGEYCGESVKPRYIYGIRGFYHPKCIEGLRLGATGTRYRISNAFQVPNLLAAPINYIQVDAEIIAAQLLLSAEYIRKNLTLAAEYAITPTRIDVGVDFPSGHPNPDLEVPTDVTGEAYYLMAEYRLNKCFKLGTYYSVLYMDRTKRHDHEKHSKDIALTLRHDVNEYFALKLEGHNIHGVGLIRSLAADTGGFASGVLGGSSTPSEHPNWWLFAVKATFSF